MLTALLLEALGCFFNIAVSFVSLEKMAHVQNGPYYVPYHFMAPFYVSFPHRFGKDKTQTLTPYNNRCRKTKRKKIIDRYCTATTNTVYNNYYEFATDCHSN